VAYPSDERDYSRVLLKKGDYFEIEIAFFRVHPQSVFGFPLGYPGYEEPDTNPVAEGITIHLEARFGFPDIEDKNIDLHQAFADGWISYLKNNWDWERFVDRTPDRAIYDIQRRLDEIEESLTGSSHDENS
jgi:hypothetical protein